MLFDDSHHPLSPALAEERRVLGDLRELLARRGGPSEQLGTLRQALADLDQLFLLVVVGEFNEGELEMLEADARELERLAGALGRLRGEIDAASSALGVAGPQPRTSS